MLQDEVGRTEEVEPMALAPQHSPADGKDSQHTAQCKMRKGARERSTKEKEGIEKEREEKIDEPPYSTPA